MTIHKTWNEYVEAHTDDIDPTTRWMHEFTQMVGRIPRQDVRAMLEVGCSAGRWIRWFKGRFTTARAAGIDIVKPRAHRGFSFRKGDARKLPYKDGAFDLVYSLGLIEHFTNDRERILREHVRVTRDGGWVLVTFPTLRYDSPMYWNLKLRYDPHTAFKHYHTTIRSTTKTLRALGLTIVETRHTGWFFEPFGIPRVLPIPQLSQVCCIVARKPAKAIARTAARRRA